MDITSNPQNLLGKTVYGSDGEKLGKAGQVFLDDETGQPEWVTVQTGLFGTKETFVPLRGVTSQGDGVAVPYDKDKIKGAPSVGADDGHISEQEEQELYRYYGLDYSSYGTTTGTGYATTGVDRDRDNDGVYDNVEGRTVGHDTSGPTTDSAMTRSEERLRVGTERVEAGRARLRKYVTTEQVSQSVPVSKERVTVEREPITEANVGNAMDGPAISEEEHEVVLHEERPVVAKEAVPVERVRLDTETVTEQVTVQDEVRKENIEVSDAGVTTDRDRF